ncbi:Zinc finger, RING-type [Penicillium expansum]|uniref:Zinc finger, RING-type n=1 Tax=Penicillium expansum TaxID=27334 RepID=A0A0A2JJY9_PENEN|nr:Zinc finger, RING-type [Penicillium expansum]KGO55136.1 Zinc finger, RING-type [Penicillium expansum]
MAEEGESNTSTPRSFAGQSVSAEEMLKEQTVGLVHLSDFRKRRADVLEAKEREAHDKSLGLLASGNSRSATPSAGDVTDGSTPPRSDGPPKKKKKKAFAKSKLSFGDDQDEGEESAATPRDSSVSRSGSKTPAEDNATPRMKANPNAPPPPKALTKASLEAEALARDTLRKEFLIMQEAVKNTDILIPFVFYDGTSIPAGAVKVKKGDHVWLFLDRCRKVGAEMGVRGANGPSKAKKDNRREWARVSVDDLMLVKGDIIVPHHYEFYYFIANRVPSLSRAGGLLFDYSSKPPVADSTNPAPSDDQLEGADKDFSETKVVDRRWLPRDLHFLLSLHPISDTMDFSLRCNSLKCRAELKEKAVVTTCSHIFCHGCADSLGLSRPTTSNRLCPACQTALLNPDDAVSTILNPTEDYKTSVLSGLDPNTIMECAGRALAFWAYQSTQEIFYQEYRAKTLTEKYANLNTQMDKVIHNANTEILSLQNKLSDMQSSQEDLQKKNQELNDMYRDKNNKLAQMTNLYNLLKARAVRSRIQTAASDTVSQALSTLNAPPPPVSISRSDVPALPPAPVTRNPKTPTFPVNPDGVEQLHRYQRSGTGSSKRARTRTPREAPMPPPARPNWDGRNSTYSITVSKAYRLMCSSLGKAPDPAPQHRTRLPRISRTPTVSSEFPPGDAITRRFGR